MIETHTWIDDKDRNTNVKKWRCEGKKKTPGGGVFIANLKINLFVVTAKITPAVLLC